MLSSGLRIKLYFKNSVSNCDCNAVATSSVTGSTSPYTYAWSTGATTPNLSGLCAGSYSLTVTSAAGCTFVNSFLTILIV